MIEVLLPFKKEELQNQGLKLILVWSSDRFFWIEFFSIYLIHFYLGDFHPLHVPRLANNITTGGFEKEK